MEFEQIRLVAMAAMSVFGLKILDCTFNTVKSVYMQKDQYYLGATFNAISAGFFNISVLITGGIPITITTVITTLAICAATFLGTLFPALMIKKHEPDQMYIFEITSDNMENGKKYADLLLAHNIPIRTSKTYTMRRKALCIKAYSESKENSRFIIEHMPPGFKPIVYCPKPIE